VFIWGTVSLGLSQKLLSSNPFTIKQNIHWRAATAHFALMSFAISYDNLAFVLAQSISLIGKKSW
jgi:hypothetical protein